MTEMVTFEMEPLIPRAINTCYGGKLWYVCTAGNFRGCCSSDPCTTGICPDDHDSSKSTDSTDMSVTTAETSRTATSSVVPLPQSTSTVTTDSTSSVVTPTQHPTVSDTSMGTETTGPTALSSVLPASHVTASPSSTPSNTPNAASSNLGALIGGVLGGVVALIIAAIIIFCCCRRRRKHGKRKTLIAWYPYKSARKNRKTASEMKGALSPSHSEANSSLSNTSPSTDITRSVVLNPGLTSHSSTTNLISHSTNTNALIPPVPPHSNELFASVPLRYGLTPELPDTGFRRRAELASHAQSELINVPLEQRQRQQNFFRARAGPRAWESPASTPTTSQGASLHSGINSGSSDANSAGGTPGRDTAGRVVTAEGVVLGANLDRYTGDMETGESHSQGDRGRSIGNGDANHVMSFMQYGERAEARNPRRGMVNNRTSTPHGHGASVSESMARPADRSLADDIAATDDDVDVPPAYDAEESTPGPDIKSPSGRMSMSTRHA